MDINKLSINKILIIDLAFIGDVLLATPVTRAVKNRWPEASLTMLTVPLTASIAAINPYVDDVLVYDKRGKHKGLMGMWRISRELKQHKFDLVICMNFAVRGAAVAWLAGIPYRLGYDAQHGSWFLTWAASHIRDGIKHETKNHLEVLKPFGFSTEDTSLRIEPTAEQISSCRQKCAARDIPQDDYYVLCPFGSYERKNMPKEVAAQVIRTLSKEHPVYLIGGNKEAAGLQEIAAAGGLSHENILAGTLTLPELAVFIQNARAMLSVDTGPMHIAQAVNCPTVAMFGPTDPAVWGPQNKNSRVLYTKEKCSPCWGKGECSENVCIKKITANQLLAALGEIGHE